MSLGPVRYESQSAGCVVVLSTADHPGATRGVGRGVDDEDFDETVAIYERLYGTAAMRGPGEATIAVRDTSLRLMTSGGLATAFGPVDVSGFQPPTYCAITVEVVDLARAAAILAETAVRHIRRPDSLVIEPAEACGIVLEFVTPAA